MKLAIVITHPIRYYVPLFAILAMRNKITIKVFYTFGDTLLSLKKYTPQYRKENEPALPLFEGYDYCFVENIAKKKSTHSFSGINNPSLTSEIEAWGADAVLVMGWNFISHLRVMRYFKGRIPVYFRGDSILLNEQYLPYYKRLARHISLRLVYRYVDKAFYVGQHNKDYFKRAGLSDSQLVYAPHAIDNGRFADYTDTSDVALQMRRQAGIAEGELIFLFAGKFQIQKNPLLLLKAFINSGIKDAHLVFVGDGPLKNELKNGAAGHSNIHFFGMQPQSLMPAIYRLCDVFVLPSRQDTWGLVINEAMACSTAVIVSDQCGCAADLVTDGYNGYILKNGNAQQLTTLLLQFAANPAKAKEMGANGFERIRQFNFLRIAEAIEQTVCST